MFIDKNSCIYKAIDEIFIKYDSISVNNGMKDINVEEFERMLKENGIFE
jgi:hypothetical protein